MRRYVCMLQEGEEHEQQLMWIAQQGITAPLPEGWKACQDEQGEVYYFNFETEESIWDHPCDAIFKKLVQDEREKLKQSDGRSAQTDGLTTEVDSQGGLLAEAAQINLTGGTEELEDGNDDDWSDDADSEQDEVGLLDIAHPSVL